MPYEITFSKKLTLGAGRDYIKECCIGGDVVMDVLLPELRKTYSDLDTGQEDWSWFAWFQNRDVRLAVDVFCDDPGAGGYRIHLTSSIPKWLFGHKIEDTSELESLRDKVKGMLADWLSGEPQVTRVKADYMPY